MPWFVWVGTVFASFGVVAAVIVVQNLVMDAWETWHKRARLCPSCQREKEAAS